jgi:hypothetical protein
VRLGAPSGSHDQMLATVWRLLSCLCGAPSLTGGRVCPLIVEVKLRPTVSRPVVPLGSESRGTQDHILLSQFLILPQPRGLGPRIYIPQEQGDPDIPPGTGFHFRRLLWLAGLRWRYSIPPPNGLCRLSWAELILLPTVSRPVRLGIGLPFGAHDQILSLSFL